MRNYQFQYFHGFSNNVFKIKQYNILQILFIYWKDKPMNFQTIKN